MMQPLIGQAVYGTFRLSQIDAEHDLLRAAGTAYLRQIGGYIPDTSDDDDIPAPCPSDDGAYAPPTALRLYRLIREYHFYPKLLQELTDHLIAGGYRIPEVLLPMLLNSTNNPCKLEPLIKHRGVWLGRMMRFPCFFDDTGRVIAFSPEDWLSPLPIIRENYFRYLRQTDPDKARELLQASWDDETHGFREVLVRMFEINLSLADEDFLENLLTEYQHTMFYVVLRMLYSLPDSRFHQHINRQIVKQVRYSQISDKVYLVNKRQPVIETDDYVVSVYDALGIVPPDFWMNHWKLDAAGLIQAALRNEKPGILLSAWEDTALYVEDTLFLAALLRFTGDNMSFRQIRLLFATLSQSQCCDIAVYWLETIKKPLDTHPARVLLWRQPAFIIDDALAEQFIGQLAMLFRNTVRPLLKRDLRKTAIELRSRISMRMRDSFLAAIQHNIRPEMSLVEQALFDEYVYFFQFRQRIYNAIVIDGETS